MNLRINQCVYQKNLHTLSIYAAPHLHPTRMPRQFMLLSQYIPMG